MQEGNFAGPADDAQPLWISLRASALHRGTILAGAVLAALVAGSVGLHPAVLAVLLLALAGLAVREWRLAGWHHPAAPRAIHLARREHDAGAPERLALKVRLADGNVVDALVLEGCFVTPALTVVRYRMPHEARWLRRMWPRLLTIWPDGIDSEDFRRLRVLLKWA